MKKNRFTRAHKTAPRTHTPGQHFVWYNLDTNRSTEDNLIVRKWINAGYRLRCEVEEW